MLENVGYRETLRIHNSYCSSMARVVTRAYQNVTFIHTVPVVVSVLYYQAHIAEQFKVSDSQVMQIISGYNGAEKYLSRRKLELFIHSCYTVHIRSQTFED